MLSERVAMLPDEIPDYTPFAPASDRQTWQALPTPLQARFIAHAEKLQPLEWGRIPFSLWMAFHREGNRERYEKQYFPRREQLATLVAAECVEYQGRFLEDVLNGIWLICEESAWQLPAHNNYKRDDYIYPLPDVARPIVDLFAAETGALLAMCKYLLGDALEAAAPGICARIDAELEKRILTPYFTEHFWWMADAETLTCNWTTWCTQNVLLTLLLTNQPETRKRQGITQAAKSIDFFLAQYAPDGCCSEGAQYFSHAGLTLWGVLDILASVAPDAFSPLFDDAKLKNIAEYIVNMHVGEGRYFNFGDCSPMAGRRTVREYLFGKAVGSEALMAFAAQDVVTDDNPERISGDGGVSGINLWYRITSAFYAAEVAEYAQCASEIPQTAYTWYPSVGLYIRRNSIYDLCVKAGGNDDSHNHNDTGSITLYKNRQPFLIDVGVETYTRKTFSPQRYEIWAMQSGWHNLPTFDGVMQQDGATYRATNVTVSEAAIGMELATAYPPVTGLTSYHRTVSLGEQGVTVIDQTDYHGTVKLTLMSEQKPEVGKAINTVVEGDNVVSGQIAFGTLGHISYQGVAVQAVSEAISITDARLRTAWPETLYKTTLTFQSQLQLEIC